MNYRPLRDGETIQRGDEISPAAFTSWLDQAGKTWEPCKTTVGMTYNPRYPLVFRRPIDDVPPPPPRFTTGIGSGGTDWWVWDEKENYVMALCTKKQDCHLIVAALNAADQKKGGAT